MEIFAKVVTNSWYITLVLGNFSPLIYSCVAPSNINTHLREYFPYVTNAVNHILQNEYFTECISYKIGKFKLKMRNISLGEETLIN
jgi:ABC-type polysaccharide/polyol phosphate export permease